jgi:hypothetical protein
MYASLAMGGSRDKDGGILKSPTARYEPLAGSSETGQLLQEGDGVN